MSIFEIIEQMLRVHELILREETGSSVVFSKRLGIARMDLYKLFDEFEKLGALIRFSRCRDTFYYENDFKVEFNVKTSSSTVKEKVYTYTKSQEEEPCNDNIRNNFIFIIINKYKNLQTKRLL